MTITILSPDETLGSWEVWAHLGSGDPVLEHESFIIGEGPTRNDAVEMAVAELVRHVTQLQQPPAIKP